MTQHTTGMKEPPKKTRKNAEQKVTDQERLEGIRLDNEGKRLTNEKKKEELQSRQLENLKKQQEIKNKQIDEEIKRLSLEEARKRAEDAKTFGHKIDALTKAFSNSFTGRSLAFAGSGYKTAASGIKQTTNGLYEAGSNLVNAVAGPFNSKITQQGVMTNTLISAMTGGVLNPVLMQALGVNKAVSGLWGAGKGLTKASVGAVKGMYGLSKGVLGTAGATLGAVSSPVGGGLTGAGIGALMGGPLGAVAGGLLGAAGGTVLGGIGNALLGNFGTTKQKKNYIKGKKQDASAVEESEGIANRSVLESIKESLTKIEKNTAKTEKEEEEKEDSLFKTLFKAAAGLALAFGALKTGISDMAGKGLTEMMKFFGSDEKTAEVTGGIFKDALPGILFGLPFGMRASLVCGGISLGANTLKRFWDDFNGNSEKEGKAPLGWGETALRGAIAGGTMGLAFGFKGAIIGAILGMGGSLIAKAYNWLEGWLGDLLGLEKNPKEQINYNQKDYDSAVNTLDNSGVDTKALGLSKEQNFTPLEKDSVAQNDAPSNFSTKQSLTNGNVPLNQSFYSRNNLSNTPEYILDNVQAVRSNVIDPLQSALDKNGNGNKVTITSSYRSPKYNQQVGGATRSKHLTGKAMDIQVSGMNPNQVVGFMQDNGIPFDRAIMEKSGNTQWLHVEYDSAGSHSGAVAKMDARTGKFAMVNPGTADLGQTSMSTSSSTPSLGEMTSTQLSNIEGQTMQTANNTAPGDIYSDGGSVSGGTDTGSGSMFGSFSGGSSDSSSSGFSQLASAIGNISGSSGNSSDDGSEIYALGDFARTLVLGYPGPAV